MSGDRRVVMLVRAAVDQEVREVVARPGLAGRVIAARRRSVRRRVGVVLAAATTAAVLAGTVPLFMDDQHEPRRQGGRVVLAAFDPNHNVTVGYVPPGLVEEAGPPRSRGFVKQPREAQAKYTSWTVQYLTRDVVPDRVNPHVTVMVAADAPALDEWLSPIVPPPRWRTVRAASGKAVMADRGAATQITWEVRPGLIVTLLAAGLPEAEALKILQGITVSE